MKRKHRHLDGEGEEESKKQQRGYGGTVGRIGINLRRRFVEGGETERINSCESMIVEIKEQNAQQHQHRSGQRVEKEFDRCVEFAWAAPDADQQIHWNQHRFPEYKEQEEIERHEYAKHPGLKNQEPDVIFLDAVLDSGPRR